MILLYSTKVMIKKYRNNIFAGNLLVLTSKRTEKSFVIKYSMREEIWWFIKESTQDKSLTHVNSAPRCGQQLETETTTREDISRTNLTFAILLITAEKNITDNTSSSIIFSRNIHLSSSISQILKKSSQIIMKIIIDMKNAWNWNVD